MTADSASTEVMLCLIQPCTMRMWLRRKNSQLEDSDQFASCERPPIPHPLRNIYTPRRKARSYMRHDGIATARNISLRGSNVGGLQKCTGCARKLAQSLRLQVTLCVPFVSPSMVSVAICFNWEQMIASPFVNPASVSPAVNSPRYAAADRDTTGLRLILLHTYSST